MRILSYGLRDFDGEEPGAAEYPRVRWALDHLQRWRTVLEEADSKAVPVLDDDIALLKRFLTGEHDILGVGSRRAAEGKENTRKVPQFGMAGGIRQGKGTLIEYAQSTARASLRIVWPGWMPFHCTTGVSDGELVVVQFFQGQVAAYEVATGKRRWAWRDPVSGSRIGQGNDGAERVFSLRMKGDAVFVTMIPGDRGVSPGLFCLDKRDGSVRWFAPYGPKDAGSSIVTPVLMDIPAGAQGAVTGQKPSWPVLIDARAAILEQATGRKVGQIYARGPGGVEQGKQIQDWFYPLVFGDRVIVGTGNDMGRHHSSVLRLQPDGQGRVDDLEEARFVGKASRMQRVRNEHFVFGPDYAYDLRTRGTVGVASAEKLAAIGDLCIGSGGFDDTKFRPRRDGAALLTLDACDPQGRAGWDHLMADYMANFWSDPPPKEGWAYHGNRDRAERRHWIQMTLRALGEQGRSRLERDFPKMAMDPLRLRIAIDLATDLRWRIEGLLKAGLEVAQVGPLSKTAPWNAQVPVNTSNAGCLPDYFAAIDAASDPTAAQILMEKYKDSWTLYPTFARNLPPERLLAWIEPIALASSHPINRGRVFSAWRAIGPAALPSMERVRAAMAGRDPAQDRLAASYADDIAKQIAELKGEKTAALTAQY